MRPFFSTTCLIVVASLSCASPLDAKGGKGGGGGGGRARGSSGGGHHGGGGGGPKWSGQQSHPGGGGQRFAEHGQKPTSGGHKHQFADKPNQHEKDKKHDKQVRSTPTNDSTGEATDAYNKKEKQLAI